MLLEPQIPRAKNANGRKFYKKKDHVIRSRRFLLKLYQAIDSNCDVIDCCTLVYRKLAPGEQKIEVRLGKNKLTGDEETIITELECSKVDTLDDIALLMFTYFQTIEKVFPRLEPHPIDSVDRAFKLVATNNVWLSRNNYVEFDLAKDQNGKILGTKRTILKQCDF